MSIEKKCQICGAVYYVPLYRSEKSKACSRKCLIVLLLSYKKTDKFKRNHINALKKQVGENHPRYGKKHTKESLRKMSESHLKNPARYWLGKNNPHMVGEKNPNWKGGVTASEDKRRKTIKYSAWRRKVLKRDNKICRVCGKHYDGANSIHVHHIYPLRKHGNKILRISNGVTLCNACHKITHYKEDLFIDYFKGILENGANSAKILQRATPSQQERLRKALWACVTVRTE